MDLNGRAQSTNQMTNLLNKLDLIVQIILMQAHMILPDIVVTGVIRY